MPTASIYYRQPGTDLHFVLVDGVSRDCDPKDGENHLTTVTRTLADMGWEPADNTTPRIIRQADGRGTITIRPRTAPNASTLDIDTVWVNTTSGIPYRVAISGQVEFIHGEFGALDSSSPDSQAGAVAAVDASLARMGFIRTDNLLQEAVGVWTASARPAENSREWRDEPTLVRIADDTARALHDMANRLGIPADTLANQWITRQAADARSRYDQFMEPGYILDHSRIKGWLFDGSPDLR